jgi:DNA-binding HxlR family transcriptional regulator
MKGYGQFCPVAKGAEVFTEKWTPLIIRELMCGSNRFNDLKRGNPLISPTILSQRLKSLEEDGVVEKIQAKGRDGTEYYLTEAGRDLGQVVIRLGIWGSKWARSKLTKEDYDPELLMWDMRRRIDTSRFPREKTVLGFMFLDMPSKKRSWWLMIENGDADLCLRDPGFEIDLLFKTTAKTMADIWMGYTPIRKEITNKTLSLTGNPDIKDSLDDWLGYSVFTNPDALLNT